MDLADDENEVVENGWDLVQRPAVWHPDQSTAAPLLGPGCNTYLPPPPRCTAHLRTCPSILQGTNSVNFLPTMLPLQSLLAFARRRDICCTHQPSVGSVSF